LATLYGALGLFDPARRALAGLTTPEALALQARLHFAAGELDAAQQMAQRGLVWDHDDVPSLNLMALIALRRGEANQGLLFLRRALRVRPFDPEATQLLAKLEESEQ